MVLEKVLRVLHLDLKKTEQTVTLARCDSPLPPQWHTSPNKATSPHSATPYRQAFKHMNVWGPYHPNHHNVWEEKSEARDEEWASQHQVALQFMNNEATALYEIHYPAKVALEEKDYLQACFSSVKVLGKMNWGQGWKEIKKLPESLKRLLNTIVTHG